MQFKEKIFSEKCFNNYELAKEIFDYQYQNNLIYKQYVDAIKCNVQEINTITEIPFLPIRFFKTHDVICEQNAFSIQFKSSGTTQHATSKHFIKDVSIYEKSFLNGFKEAFGNPKEFLILGLLPNYIEQGDSSLVYMVNALIQESKYVQSNMYLYDMDALQKNLLWAQQNNVPTILFGVTYALLQFAEKYSMPLQNTYIIETGGMKGRGPELTRAALHSKLQDAFGISQIYSEYGMTELLSQAYSKQDEIFEPASTMQVLIRDLYDPFEIKKSGKGAINIIDFSNLYSCSFVATDDQGTLFENGKFTITGRLDNSDMRGCNLLE
jgi:phenylacetate-coenzyme A ligase PaaK-like adenylate-forming protein